MGDITVQQCALCDHDATIFGIVEQDPNQGICNCCFRELLAVTDMIVELLIEGIIPPAIERARSAQWN